MSSLKGKNIYIYIINTLVEHLKKRKRKYFYLWRRKCRRRISSVFIIRFLTFILSFCGFWGGHNVVAESTHLGKCFFLQWRPVRKSRVEPETICYLGKLTTHPLSNELTRDHLLFGQTYHPCITKCSPYIYMFMFLEN